jgi:hypothetical protein
MFTYTKKCPCSVNMFNNLDYLLSQVNDFSQTVQIKTAEDVLTKIHTLSTSRTYP